MVAALVLLAVAQSALAVYLYSTRSDARGEVRQLRAIRAMRDVKVVIPADSSGFEEAVLRAGEQIRRLDGTFT